MSIDPEHLLSALRRARGKGLSLKQLSGQLRLGQSQRHPLRRALADLMKHGRASYDGHVYRKVEGHDRADGDRRTASGETPRPQSRRAPAAMIEGARMHRDKGPAQGARKPGAEVTGVIHLKAEGYGFVSPLLGDGGREDDLFVPPQFTRGALDGDVVRARAIRGRDGRLAGEVLEVVERRRQLALGIYQAKGKAQWVIPHDRNLTGNIAVPRHPRARDGDMVKVRLHREIQGALQGEIISVLGDRGDPRFEILAAAYAEGFSDEFDPATLIAAQSVPDHVHPDEISGRRDLRHLPLVTIDGEDARDFDDAVHVSRTPGGYRLVVAIADVAHYVRPGGPLDREALRRATSVYFPGTVLPMLPERLSNGICSLNPDVDRLCTVCDLALDKSGTPLQADIYEAVMRSHARLTYTRVAEALAGDADPQLRPLLDDLKAAHELSKKLTRRRQLRGSIDFDLPEAKIVLDEQGRVAEIARRPRNDAHRLVEEFMLAANEAVARFFEVRGLPTVYRVHDLPDEEKLAAYDRGREVAQRNTDIDFEDRIVDNMCMQLVLRPQEYDLLCCPNLYGDIISDLGAGMIGGLGLAPGANIGTNGAVFEATHGSAPKYAGQNRVNPMAVMLSGVLMLRYLEETAAADALEKAIANVIALGENVTYDLKEKRDDPTAVGTSQVADAVIAQLKAAV